MSPRPHAAAFALLLTTASPAQTVRIVDAGTGGPGALQAAVLASSPGDILRIRPGTYTPTSVTRGLNLLAEPTADCHQLLASGIPAGQTLTVVGLNLIGIPGAPPHASLDVRTCSGKVFFSSAMVAGRQDMASFTFPFFSYAVYVDRAELHVENSTLIGAEDRSTTIYCDRTPQRAFSGSALGAFQSRVTLSGCTLRGGNGKDETRCGLVQGRPCNYSVGKPGGVALGASATTVVLDRCTLMGGSGANGTAFGCESCTGYRGEAGAGGPAVSLDSGSTLIGLKASALRAGASGTSSCGRAGPSPAIMGSASSVILDPTVVLAPESGAPGSLVPVMHRTMPSLEGVTRRASLGAPASWIHRDQPGALAMLFLAVSVSKGIPHPLVLGGLDVEPSNLIYFDASVLSGFGILPLAFGIPNDAGLKGRHVYVQSVGIDAGLVPTATPITALFIDF